MNSWLEEIDLEGLDPEKLRDFASHYPSRVRRAINSVLHSLQVTGVRALNPFPGSARDHPAPGLKIPIPNQQKPHSVTSRIERMITSMSLFSSSSVNEKGGITTITFPKGLMITPSFLAL